MSVGDEKVAPTADVGAAETDFLVFRLDAEAFAVDAANVREIIDITPVTEVPNANPFVPGLVNVRGDILPLVDLRRRFHLQPMRDEKSGRKIVIDAPYGGGLERVVMHVDSVDGVVKINAAKIDDIPDEATTWDKALIKGATRVDDSIIIALNLENLFELNAQQLTMEI